MLYREYRKNHFITAAQMHAEGFEKTSIHALRIISVDGAIWVNLIPADSFALELPRINKDPDAGLFQTQPKVRLIGAADNPAITWRQSGDTLFIKGNFTQPLHRPWSAWYYRNGLPEVSILGPEVDEVLLNNSQLYVQGAKAPVKSASARFIARNSTLWIGMQYEDGHHGPAEYFDSLDIRSANTITILNSPASIHRLQMQLTDTSLVNDQFATLDSSVIRSTPESRIEFTGGNLKKNQLIIH
jgi:hypothetical protein